MNETKLADKLERNERTCIETNHTVTIPPYYISIVPLTPINHTGSIQRNTLLEIEENPFISIKQLNITIIPTLKTLQSRTPDKFMAILWNQGGHNHKKGT